MNFDEPGAAEIAEELLELGVEVEAGLSGIAAAESLVRAGIGDRCLRVLLEPQEPELSAALATAALVEQVLGDHDAAGGVPRLLHGLQATAWPLLKEAARRGYDARIGLEDTLRLPAGEIAEDNVELVRAADMDPGLNGRRAG